MSVSLSGVLKHKDRKYHWKNLQWKKPRSIPLHHSNYKWFFLSIYILKILFTEIWCPSKCTCSHLEFLQHGCLICEAQITAADTQLLCEVIEVDLQRNRGGLWDKTTQRRRAVLGLDVRNLAVMMGVSLPGGHGEQTPATGLSSSCPSGRGSLRRLHSHPAGEASSPPPWTPAGRGSIQV